MDKRRRLEAIVFIFVVGISYASGLDGTCSDSSCSNNGVCTNISESESNCTCNDDYIGEECQGSFRLTAIIESLIPEVGNDVILSVQVNKSDNVGDVTVMVTPPGGSPVSIAKSDNLYNYTVDKVQYANKGNIYTFNATTIFNGSRFDAIETVEIAHVLTVSISTVEGQATHFEEGSTDAELSVAVTSDGGFDNITVSVTLPSGMTETLTTEGEGTTRTYSYRKGSAISQDDEGNYTFSATETFVDKSRIKMVSYDVIVEVPPTKPTITVDGEVVTGDHTVVRGTESTFVCSSEGEPSPTIQWQFNGNPIDTSPGDIYQDENNLVFATTSPFGGGGTYVCKATSTLVSTGDKEETTELEITINGAPEVTSFSMPMQKESISFTCTFNGFPLPDVSWTWKDDVPFSNDLFAITNSDSTTYTRTSTVEIEHSALCLGAQTITCTATNTLGSTNSDIPLNPDPYSIYKSMYFTFPNTMKSHNDAKDDCSGLDGTLAQPATEELRDQLVQISSTLDLSSEEFYIGLEYDGEKWLWADGTEAGSVTWVSAPAQSCVFLSGGTYSTAECMDSRRYICQIQASKAPIDLSSSVDRCDGSKTELTWTQDGFFEQRLFVNDSTIEANLDKEENLYSLTDLTKGQLHTAKISTGHDLCELHPFDLTSFTTANARAAQPVVLPTNYSNGECQIGWSYPRETAEIDAYNITYREFARGDDSIVTNQGGDSSLAPDSTSWTFETNPYSSYTITVVAVSCIGDSIEATTVCQSPPAPTTVSQPLRPPAIDVDTSQGILVQIKQISNRNGPIDCIYVVVRYRNSDNSNPFEQVNLDFEGIKTSDEEVSNSEDYFAFALSNQDRNVTLGRGGNLTSCGTNPMGRKKREVDSLQGFSARNRGLVGNKNYQYYFIAATNGENGYLFSVSSWSPIIEVRPAPVPTNIVAIVVPNIIILVILIILVLAGIWWKKKRSKKDYQDPPSNPNSHVNQAFSEAVVYENVRIDRSIAVENLASTYQAKHSDEDRIFREEYRALAMEVSEIPIHFNYAMALEVRDKNRFSNIHPANESRVVLRRQGTDIYSDYINASYLDGYRQPRKFIAAQGPLLNTLGDFWYMVWEQEATVIVMLTNVEEGGRKKCEKYWPEDDEASTFENLIVRGVTTVVYGSIVKRTFQVRNPNQSEKILVVDQFHFVAWPDHGVPITTSALFNLRRMVQECQGHNPSPIIVHCSAGVGRTGTFIALDVLSNQMEREKKVDIYGAVVGMRRKRKEMVQTVEQYSLLHKLMLEKYLFGVTDLSNSEFQTMHYESSYAQYEEIDSTSRQFRNLSLVGPIKTEKYCPPKDQHKIRDPEVVPYQHCRVVIRLRPSEEEIRFFNASYVQTYNASDAFIASQSPTEDSLEDFWRVILDNNVTVVVMLSNLNEGLKQCSQYWPEDCLNPCTFGDVIVSLQSETKENGYVERRMQVSEKVLHLRRSLNVLQLHYEHWPESGAPANTNELLELISRTQASRQTNNGKTFPVLVHCSDGAGRTGTFCAIVNLIERLKNEDKVDVFRTVKDLRDMRPLMVRTEEQYKFCFKAVKEYLSSFDLYANFK